MGRKESVADTARVLGRMFDAIEFRGFSQRVCEELARFAGVPVWNGLTDEDHPTQALADLLTLQENFGHLRGLKLTYVGDGRNNVSNALLFACMKMGLTYAGAREIGAETGARLELDTDPRQAVRGADAIYTDVWVSMGEEDRPGVAERVEALRPYQVNAALMAATGKRETIFLHCLPAHHTDGVHDMEVSEEVFESPASKVFDQAENRLHTIKAVMVATIG